MYAEGAAVKSVESTSQHTEFSSEEYIIYTTSTECSGQEYVTYILLQEGQWPGLCNV